MNLPAIPEPHARARRMTAENLAAALTDDHLRYAVRPPGGHVGNARRYTVSLSTSVWYSVVAPTQRDAIALAREYATRIDLLTDLTRPRAVLEVPGATRPLPPA